MIKSSGGGGGKMSYSPGPESRAAAPPELPPKSRTHHSGTAMVAGIEKMTKQQKNCYLIYHSEKLVFEKSQGCGSGTDLFHF